MLFNTFNYSTPLTKVKITDASGSEMTDCRVHIEKRGNYFKLTLIDPYGHVIKTLETNVNI